MQRMISKLPPQKALLAFEAVMRLGTVTAAAKELTSTQPAISQHIKNLEINLNAQLFNRRGRLLAPTDTAREFYQTIAPLLNEIATAAEELRVASLSSNLINIVCNSGLAHFWFLPLLPILQEKHPQLVINISVSDFAEYFPDRALRLSFGQFSDSKHQHRLFIEQVFAICSQDYAKANQLGLHSTLADLLAQPLVHLDTSDQRWLNWQRWLGGQNLALKKTESLIQLGNYHSVINAVLQGQGVALGWQCLIQPLLNRQQLVQVTSVEQSREDFGYFIDSELATGEGDRLVIDFLKQAASQQ